MTRIEPHLTSTPLKPVQGALLFRARLLSGLVAITTVLALILASTAVASSAITSPATKVHHTTAVLNGHLDPEGDLGIVDCDFEWGPTTAYGNTAPCAEGNSFSAPADVSATITGLSAGTTYHFRLDIDTTSSGSPQGLDHSFTTGLAPAEHPLIASFGKDGTADSIFASANSLAIDQARQKLYVLDRQAKRIHGYDISNPPSFPPAAGFSTIALNGAGDVFPQTQIAADSSSALGSSGNLYVGADRSEGFQSLGELEGFTSNGAAAAGFPINPAINPGPPKVLSNFITGTAVAPNGEIWIFLNEQQHFFLRYSSTGAYLGSVDSADAINGTLAFDSNGDLYAATLSGDIWKYTASSNYTSVSEFATVSGGLRALAVDPSSHYLYARSNDGLAILSPAGEQFDRLDVSTNVEGIAVDQSDHSIYLARGGKVEVYATGAAVPALTATTAAPVAVTGSTAILKGFVDPEGTAVSECKFEYDFSSGYDKSVPCEVSPGSGSGDVAVSAQVTGLTPGTSYHYRLSASNAFNTSRGKDEKFSTNPLPGLGSPGVSNLTYDSADLEASVDPKGFETSYRFEYGPTIAYGTTVPIPDGDAGSGPSPVTVSGHIGGLEPDTLYHWRIVAESANGSAVLADQTFISYGPVKAETVGSPIRTATTARLEGRVNPDGAPTTFHFEYGEAGPCDANPCTALPARSAGSGGAVELVSEKVEGLAPNTTYHYRVIAENATLGSPSIGGDMTVTTRASDDPLSHGHFPGPPESDRAYEQVSLPDSSGNPVESAHAISDDGNRVIYQIAGGNPVTETGTAFNQLFTERTAGGWRTRNVAPPRDELVASSWGLAFANSSLTSFFMLNNDNGFGKVGFFRLSPESPAENIFEVNASEIPVAGASEDLSRIVSIIHGPTYKDHLYDVSSGAAQTIDLMPDGSESTCGIPESSIYAPFGALFRAQHWISANGSLAFYPAGKSNCGEPQLYLREMDAGQSKLVSGPVLSGPTCGAAFIRSTADAAFFWTRSRLDPSDTAADTCGGTSHGDLYRYDLAAGALDCVTCVGSGIEADIQVGVPASSSIAVSDDGSRAYFYSPNTLLVGAGQGIYRVKVASGEFAYVGTGDKIFATNQVGDVASAGQAISPDGSTLIFAASDPGLNALGGQQNGGTRQYYRYDDDDRSLICVSCPQDGSVPRAQVKKDLTAVGPETGPNTTPLSTDGEVFAFATSTSLVNPDQNTTGVGQNPVPGTDVYEWRDGHVLLITDGLTNSPDNDGFELGVPRTNGISPSGRDIYFTVSAQYTPDALDGFRRLYDARIGGGFDFPSPPKPCPLEVCQGTPKGVPEEVAPGSGSLLGAGNKRAPATTRCAKPKRKVRSGGKTRCVKPKRKLNAKKANDHRRAGR